MIFVFLTHVMAFALGVLFCWAVFVHASDEWKDIKRWHDLD